MRGALLRFTSDYPYHWVVMYPAGGEVGENGIEVDVWVYLVPNIPGGWSRAIRLEGPAESVLVSPHQAQATIMSLLGVPPLMHYRHGG